MALFYTGVTPPSPANCAHRGLRLYRVFNFYKMAASDERLPERFVSLKKFKDDRVDYTDADSRIS